jgi:hypothetical protein
MPMRAHAHRAVLLLLLTIVLTSLTSLTAPTWADARAAHVRVRHVLFGAADPTADSASLTRINEGSVRLWGVGVRWDEVQTSRHHYDWARLDQLVTAAQAAHAEVTMVVAMTPSFYASKPTDPPQNIDAYRQFVRALMKRYRSFHGQRGIAAYQVWNEVNISTYWTGTTRQLAELTRAMSRTRDRFDPHAIVVGPPMVTRLKFELEGIAPYYSYRLDGVPVRRYVDAVALHLYPMPEYGHRVGVPEDSMKLLAAARRELRRAGVPASKPIWNTEVNYGLRAGSQGGMPARPLGNAAQAANVMRTYLLNAANGVKRVFWWRYAMGHSPSSGTIANTVLSVPGHPDELTPAGHAFAMAQQWMHGRLLGTRGHRPCRKDRHGTYTCVVRDSSGTRYIYWNPFHTARVTLPGRVHHRESVLGRTSDISPRSSIIVHFKPVMVSR